MVDPPNIVYVDASFHDGLAGLGIAGALGQHAHQVHARSSFEAEMLAMRFAWYIAKQRRLRDLVFCTDCTAVANCFSEGAPSRDWIVSWVPRAINSAHIIARRARKEPHLYQSRENRVLWHEHLKQSEKDADAI